MSSLASMFSESAFKGTILRYAGEAGWEVAELHDNVAQLEFRMASGRLQGLWITRYDSTLEFSVPTCAQFDRDADIPHSLSTSLLKRSADAKIGFWCIEKLSGKLVFSCMHNAELQLVTSSYFAAVVRRLVTEADDFEALFLNR